MDYRRGNLFFARLNLVLLGSSSGAFGDELRDSPRRTELSDLAVAAPLEMHSVHPVVQASVNGQGPYRFLVDTDAAGCGRISANLADCMRLSDVGGVMAGDPSGQHHETAKRVGVKQD